MLVKLHRSSTSSTRVTILYVRVGIGNAKLPHTMRYRIFPEARFDVLILPVRRHIQHTRANPSGRA
jgi:hypothetical protein